MIDKLIAYSVENKLVIGLLTLALVIWGVFSLRQLPIDAVPDITNNQVQIITTSPTLATQEVERFITTPIELSLQNIQQLVEIRSISRFGLSVVTVVFEEEMDIYLARQLVSEHLREAEEDIPAHLGKPVLSPISTGLGEIYQYVLRPESGYEEKYSPMDLRTIQDWVVRRQLSGIDGVVEVNTLGGYLKQYEVALQPDLLKAMDLSIVDVFSALQNSNENTGGAYIERNPNTYYIRTNGIAESKADLESIVVKVRGGKPVLIKDIATVQMGKAPRYGAMTRNEKEVVGGTVMMLKGANSAAVTERIKDRVTQIQKSLPKGVVIEPYLVRDKLINTAIGTVKTNLLEGGLIVIFILVMMLGNWRAGLIVASVIPLAMLFAVAMMNVLGISANLMSLGAIDFGLIVDGAVIIVEAIVHRLRMGFAGQRLSDTQMDGEVTLAAQKIRSSAAFGEIIILIVYVPILALVGIEGKMFKPMAQTVMLAISGALVLSLTYVPMMTALMLGKTISDKRTIADRIIHFCQGIYTPLLHSALRFKTIVIAAVVALFIGSIMMFSQMGGEFIPTLEEGDLALHQILPPGSSLSQSVEVSKLIQQKLLADFPEIEDVVTKIGSSEIPTDPMPVETGDIMVIMRPKSEWTSAKTRQEMFEKMEASLLSIPGVAYEFSQPIQMRFNELMTGARGDIAIKLFGDDLDLLFSKAKEAERIIRTLDGIGTVKVEQTVGMPQLMIDFKYDQMARYGLQVKEVNQVIRAAFAGEKAGTIYEGDRRYDLVVRLEEKHRQQLSDVSGLYIPIASGAQIPLKSVASVKLVDAPMQISRENTNRRIVISVNLGNADVESLVHDIQAALDTQLDLPSGYYFTYGGQFENLQAANARLRIAVPIALGLIFILLYFTFGSFSQALLIFTTIPLSAIGGVWALVFRDMPFSISAGIGFIALFGVAVLNGIVLIGYFNQLRLEGILDIRERILSGTRTRLRPVLMTAGVASLGFLPMALSTSGGAEVQRPLATVVIGGLVTATFLTLVVLPILYNWLAQWQEGRHSGRTISNSVLTILLLPLWWSGGVVHAQQQPISLEEAVNMALQQHPAVEAASLQVEQGQALQQMPYVLGRTVISYQGDGLFRPNGQQVNQIGVVQNIPHPMRRKSQNAQQDEQVTQYNLQHALTINTLRLQVEYVYLDLQQRKALSGLYQELVRMYSRYLEMANTRVRTGVANRMESLSLQTALSEYQLLLRQTTVEVLALEKRLANVLHTETSVTPADTLDLYSFVVLTDTNSITLRLAAQQVRLEQTKVDMLIANSKPNFMLGFAAQRFWEDGWLSGLQAGVSVPLFRQTKKKQLAAQGLQVTAAKAQLEATKSRVYQQQLDSKTAIQLYAEGAAYYAEQIAVVNPELARIAGLNYQSGELPYLEVLNVLQLIGTHKRKYLEQVLAHNKAVALYRFYAQ